jgi:hypothetical protein
MAMKIAVILNLDIKKNIIVSMLFNILIECLSRFDREDFTTIRSIKIHIYEI